MNYILNSVYFQEAAAQQMWQIYPMELLPLRHQFFMTITQKMPLKGLNLNGIHKTNPLRALSMISKYKRPFAMCHSYQEKIMQKGMYDVTVLNHGRLMVLMMEISGKH